MRAVVDPNILVSAWISKHGFPRRILEAAEDGRFEMVVSTKVIEELTDVLSRQRLRRYGTLALAEEHIVRIRRVGVGVEMKTEPERVVPDDPKDDYLVALSRASGADYLISGDPHLLRASLGEGVLVLTPRQFAELLDRGDPEGAN